MNGVTAPKPVEVPRKTKRKRPRDTAIPLLGINPKGFKAGLGELFLHPCSQQPEGCRSNPSVHRWVTGEAERGAHVQWHITEPRKGCEF